MPLFNPPFTFTTQINNQVGTTYTFALTDQSKLVTFANAAPIVVTIPTNISVAFPVGTSIDCSQLLAGKVTFAPEDGTVTINSKGGLLSIGAQWVGVSLVQIAANQWLLIGDLI